MLGTKLRALYQRRKGRDLYDIHKAFTTTAINADAIIRCFKSYMQFSTGKIPSQKEFLENMNAKIIHPTFLGDITALLRKAEKDKYDQDAAYELVKEELISRM